MEVLGTLRTRTTAYHPTTNGIVERFHRQLKASLKCYSHPEHWAYFLPLVMLGIQSSLKDDLGCTAAEMVYGTTLRLPGMFFMLPSNHTDTADPSNYVQLLQSAMHRLQPTPPRSLRDLHSHVNSQLHSQFHVFIRQDSVLDQPYKGPFKVISRTKKHFSIDVNGRQEIVSVDRLKPAFILHQSYTPDIPLPNNNSTPPPTVTRSGRRVHFPDHLTY